MPASPLLFVLLLAADATECDSAAHCNTLGSAAYQAGRLDDAIILFDRQLDYADTARLAAGDDDPGGRLAAAVQTALNNAALVRIRAGQCLQARAYLDQADPAGKATLANRKLLGQQCGAQLALDSRTGDYWKYASHGGWSMTTIKPGPRPGTLLLSAAWMHVGAGPLYDNGPGAMNDIHDVLLTVDGDIATGSYPGWDADGDEASCQLRLRFAGQAIEIDDTWDEECNRGGGAPYYSGRYVLVSTTPTRPQF